jgi:hypothetical protein
VTRERRLGGTSQQTNGAVQSTNHGSTAPKVKWTWMLRGAPRFEPFDLFFSKLSSDLAHFAPATLLHTYVNTSPLPAACCFTRT